MLLLNNDLNMIINYDLSNNKLIPDNPNVLDFLNCMNDLSSNIITTDTKINNYIKYNIDDYNKNLTGYVKKYKDISNIYIKNVINTLKIINVVAITELKNQLVLYGIIRNTNLNFYYNHLRPTIKNGKYKKEYYSKKSYYF